MFGGSYEEAVGLDHFCDPRKLAGALKQFI
jgi:hypothetical protein